MADLELEAQNPAEKTTELVATPHDLGPNELMDFDGGNILEVKPGTTLLNGKSSNFSGIFAIGMGTGSGVLGVGSIGIVGRAAVPSTGVASGTRVVGEGATGVHGKASGTGVLGEGSPGVHGKASDSSTGVVGEGLIGVAGLGGVGVDGEGFGVGVRARCTDNSHPDSCAVRAFGGAIAVDADGITGIRSMGSAGPAIRAVSSDVQAGHFKSGRAPQIHLAPLDGPADPSQLKVPGKMGDLLVLLHRRQGENEETPVASLWFCMQEGASGLSGWKQLA